MSSGTTLPIQGDRVAAAFVALLRAAGVVVPVSRAMTFIEALDVVGVDDRENVYWAARSTLLSGPEDVETFDAAFAVYWDGRESHGRDAGEQVRQNLLLLTDEGEKPTSDGEVTEPDGPTIQLRFSAVEVLRDVDFASCSDDELDQLHALMAELKFTSYTRPSRRLVATRRSARHPDLRRTIRAAMATGGEPIRRMHRKRDRRPRRLVLLVDVSGSMESYARALLRFTHAAVAGRTRVEAFTIGTRLTRITRELKSRDPDAAMDAAGAAVLDWSGGTRLGETIREFNDQWGVRGVARGAVVVILSDGWDRGDPTELAEQMQRLHRVTHKLIWVNPLKHTPGYAPLARGMAAALPHVDAFVEGHALRSLERLAHLISRG